METRPPSVTASAVVSLQWSHRLSAMETLQQPDAHSQHHHPSMEPPPFGDGNLIAGTVALGMMICLQWSHRLSAMETSHDAPQRPGGRLPSMGPPPFGDGNRPPARKPCCRCLPFNGATAFRRWERWHPSRRPATPAPFNGATAFRRWEPLFLACLRRKSGRKCAFPQRTDKE